MRSFRILLIIIALLVCLHTVIAAPRFPLARRQDGSEPTSVITTTSDPERSSSTSRPRESSVSQSAFNHQSTTGEPASRSSIIATSTSVSASPSATAISTGSLTNGTDSGNVSEDPLPLHPKITPALGLIGAILLISGALYAVVGIKNKWIYVFGSAAYLASLAVTVLIIYLMSPPVSNAVQGAFFVAAFVTGMLFGGLALIFTDLTEGLGCLLGGFCVSMWFLSLKEGGVITSTTGRAIFIGCMSVAGYSLSFSHYTRTYGLIGAISFSGATIAMLGVDCFSRAGWKEFWLFLWNLNPDVFPLNTTTYPLTKGLKAELAGVVILTVFGVISQLRLWRLVQERRAKREEQEQEQAQSQRLHEAELGREIEDKFQKERREWEATYGETGAPGSSGESGSASSLNEKDYPATAYDSKVDLAESEKKQAVVAVASLHEDDEIRPVDATGAPVARSTDISRSNSARPSSEAVTSSRVSRTVSVTGSLKPSSSPPPPPVVIPLPFKIPQEDDAMSHTSDNASVSALPDTEVETPLADEPSISRRASGKPTMKRMSTARSSVDGFQAEDVVMLSQIEDDRRSSVAATLDEEDRISLPQLSRPSSFVNDDSKTEDPTIYMSSLKLNDQGEVGDSNRLALGEDPAISSSTPTIDVQSAESLDEGSNTYGSASSLSQSGPCQSLTVSTDPKHDVAGSEIHSPRSPRLRHDTLVKEDSEKSASAQSGVEDLPNVLRPRLSKVAQSYRTNEWAKHLEVADKPEVDDISEPSSPGAQLDHEQPAPVSEGIAQPFAVAKRASKRISSDSNVHRKNAFMQINSNSARQSQSEVPAAISQQPLGELGRRVSSVPIQAPSKTQTLMGHRESLMRNRVSTQNFNQHISSSSDLTATADEDMTLAQRKRVLKHQKPPSAAQKWKKSSWAVGPPVENFDSHQPKRTVGSGSDQRREELLAGWRGSIQATGTGVPLQNAASREEQQRAAMMNAKRQKEMEQQQQAAMAHHRESMRHNMMRSNEMLDVHREAMRRMQAAANKTA
ncbi:uncharacterized protein CC84DRAFT_721528 [Paraphaeosphaeria sporulosa]|uniref:TM7S3/TM198-like domain-containing protein n=1 Tax=Paraphaeosphaeria sporulosa TaxID=1460663 RepID=A0A177CCM2_9PLEO|nr:uncharacterized protein CC84DRAFT_721528 [Paraphaeosphaeria sporulosa]OAG05404.1 hypothetical protein CC84DRAFT_721528 [Paraphaeosphaeria sporulosa]